MKGGCRGFTLLEMLLVLTVMAGLAVVSIRMYQQQRHHLAIQQIRQDKKIILQALNQYYHQVERDESDFFPVEKRKPHWQALDLPASQEQRLPWVQVYQVVIVADGVANNNKPLYALQLRATLDPEQLGERMHWLAEALGAKEVASNTLTWTMLPDNGAAKSGKAMWGFNSAAAEFKQQQTIKK